MDSLGKMEVFFFFAQTREELGSIARDVSGISQGFPSSISLFLPPRRPRAAVGSSGPCCAWGLGCAALAVGCVCRVNCLCNSGELDLKRLFTF